MMRVTQTFLKPLPVHVDPQKNYFGWLPIKLRVFLSELLFILQGKYF